MDDNISKLPTKIGSKSLVGISEIEKQPRQDLSYRSVVDGIFSGVTFRQSLFNGSVFRNCAFTSIDFSRCDFEGVRFERCQFLECSFEGAQLRSVDISETQFRKCEFESSTFTDIRTSKCQFEFCGFGKSFIRNCIHTESEFHEITQIQSNYLQCKFQRCKFSQYNFGNCTFLLHIFEKCDFIECGINADSIGYTYGISLEDLDRMKLVFLGEKQEGLKSKDLVDGIFSEYKRRNWILACYFLMVSYRLQPIDRTLDTLSLYLISLFTSSELVKRDEIDFLLRVLEQLQRESALPLRALNNFFEALTNIEVKFENPRNQAVHRYLVAQLQLQLTAMIQILGKSLNELNLDNMELAVEVQFQFDKQPEVPLTGILYSVSQNAGLTEATIEFRSSHNGSYIEVIWTTISVLVALQVALFCFEGLLVRITRIRARLGALSRRRLPIKFQKAALDPSGSLEPALIKLVAALAKPAQKNESELIDAMKVISESHLTQILIENQGALNENSGS